MTLATIKLQKFMAKPPNTQSQDKAALNNYVKMQEIKQDNSCMERKAIPRGAV